MKIVGIVAEYNPFHNGHQHHIAESRRLTGADFVVCVMSGSFTQRGEPAFLDKWTRAETALLGGADLVLELPLPFSLGSAETFAFGAVYMLHSLGVVDFLSFGGENPDLALLRGAAAKLLDPETMPVIKRHLKEGASFPAARQKALEAGGETAAFLARPNNILGVEYLKSLALLHSPITPVVVPRHSTGYHDPAPDGAFASAKAIRKILAEEGPSCCLPLLPEKTRGPFLRAVETGRYFLADEAYSKAVMACLKKLTAEELARVPDVGEGLQNRIVKAARESFTLEDFFARLKTKRYMRTRLNRIVMRSFLGLDASFCPPVPPYARILGLGPAGREILRRMEDTSSIPILTKAAHIRLHCGEARRLFALECRATSLYNLLLKVPQSREDMTTSPVVTGG